MKRKISTIEELERFVEEIGFLPFLSSMIPGFSLKEMTEEEFWWTGMENDPWEWRKTIASEGKLAYGKLFSKNAGFVSRAFYPEFACFRRDGYDFDTLYECGMASTNELRIMEAVWHAERPLASYELKKASGVVKGFEGALTNLQMKTYLTVCGFVRKQSKMGEEYGWPVALYTTPERLFGEDYVRSFYGQEKHLKQAMTEKLSALFPNESEAALLRFFKA